MNAFGRDSLFGKQTDVSVDTDGEGRIRLLTTEMTLAEVGTLALTLRYDDFGVAVDVQPPPADQVEEAANLGTGSSSQQFTVGSGSSASPEDRKEGM